MLDIVLLILKIIGILILTVLGLILAVVLLVLLVPIRYQVQASYHQQLKAAVRISWLFRLLSVFVTYDEELAYSVRLLGFIKLLTSEKADAASEGEFGEETETFSRAGEKPAQTKDAIPTDVIPAPTEEPVKPAKKTADAEALKSSPKSLASDTDTAVRTSILSKIKNKITLLCGKIKSLSAKGAQVRAFFTDPENQATIRLIFRQFKAILKHLLPQKVKGEAVLGFDDPATTGQVLSLCSLLCVWYGEALQITPVFDESIMEADVELKGRIRPGTLMVLALRILFNKNFRVLIKRWRANGGL